MKIRSTPQDTREAKRKTSRTRRQVAFGKEE